MKTVIITVVAVNFNVWGFMSENKIAEMIRFHRKISGLSQQELAKLSGLGKTVIFDIENGKLSVKLDTYLKVMAVLNIEMKFESPLMKKFEESLNAAS